MLIRYLGTGERIWGEHVWNAGNGYVVEVEDPLVVADLLTYPREQFVLDEDEPLREIDGIGSKTLPALALAGIADVADLARLDDGGIEKLAGEVWASAKQIRAWVEQARGMVDWEEPRGSSKQEETKVEEVQR